MKFTHSNKIYDYKKWSSMMMTSIFLLVGIIVILISTMPREGRDYDGYIELFSGGTEIQDIRNLELFSSLIYLVASFTEPHLGFVLLSGGAVWFIIKIIQQAKIELPSAALIYISITITYLIIGYGYYLRQFVALTMLGCFVMTDSNRKWIYLALAFLTHVNTAAISLFAAPLFIVNKRYPLLVMLMALALSILTISEANFISNSIRELVAQYDVSYGWYFSEVDADPTNRLLYEVLIYLSIAFISIKKSPDSKSKNVFLPVSWLGFIVILENIFLEYSGLTARVTNAFDFFAIVAIVKLKQQHYKSNWHLNILLFLIVLHGLKKGFDVI